MRTSDTIAELAASLADAQHEFEGVEKTAANPFFKSSYADLASIIESVAPVLHQHGLSITQMVDFDPITGNDMLTSRLMHISGEYMESSMRLFLVKNDPQGQGSAVTYARRYQIQAMLNLRTVDDDGNSASAPPPQTTRRAAPRQQPAPQADPDTGEVQERPQAGPGDASPKQLALIRSLWDRKGFPDDQSVRSTYIAEIIGREIEGYAQMTKRDASQLIDALMNEADSE